MGEVNSVGKARTIVLLLAGGIGARMGAEVPKQFMKIGGRPVIMYTLAQLEKAPVVDGIVIACIEGWEQRLRAWIAAAGIEKVTAIVPGGGTRYASTRRGMESLAADDDDVIVVHDAVRPLVSDDSLASVVSVARRFGNSMAVLECTDTMYERTGLPGEALDREGRSESGNSLAEDSLNLGYTARVVARERLVRGLTPEAVTGRRMREMYARADARGIRLDSISVLQSALGWEIHFAKGDRINLKLTRPEDVELFRALLALREKTRAL